MDELNELLRRLLWKQLHVAGLLPEDCLDAISPDAPEELSDGFLRWWQESLLFLERSGYLTFDGKMYYPVQSHQDSQDQLWQEWDRKRLSWLADKTIAAYTALLDVTMRALPEILRGKKPATDVIFPHSTMTLVEGIYKNNPVADYYNEVLADTVVACLHKKIEHDPSARIRIIEIGAGTGGTSTMVFNRLRSYQHHIEEYCFTDLSKAFLHHAEKEYCPQYPYLTCGLFDLSKPLSAQSIRAGSYDIAIATNVLHATKNIRHALRNTKAVLRRNGVLLINEITENSLLNHLTFGLLEGWWMYEDTALRIPGCPALYPEMWKSILESEGFISVQFQAKHTEYTGQEVIVAASDGVIRQRREAPRSRADVCNKEITYETPVTSSVQENDVKQTILTALCESLKVAAHVIDNDEAFSDYGVDSIIGVQLIHTINERLHIELQTTDIFDYPCVNQLASYILPLYQGISGKFPLTEQSHPLNPHTTGVHEKSQSHTDETEKALSFQEHILTGNNIDDIAIIGLSGRFPQSDNVQQLWDHLAGGHDLIQKVTRWTPEEIKAIEHCSYGGFLEEIDRFDPFFFKISGTEAMYMDPQQRFFLEESWKTLENAGYAGSIIQGRKCGVYVGYCGGDYDKLISGQVPPQAFWGNAASIVPARVSYFLNLQGPAIAVDTACSSSLVAIHLACQALRSGEVEFALAGGVFIQSTPYFYISSSRAGMLSPTGRCHTFDELADGFVPGEGVGVVMLKRLKEAIRDRDYIHGVIRGTSINQDGSTNGITAPSAASQERLERQLYDDFGIQPDRVQMIEAHGTGTKLGDPIEFDALTRSFRHYTDRNNFCAIGSVKTNIGHTIAAAGIAGVIKVLLSMRYKKIPPSIHYSSENPNIRFKDSPFYVNTQLKSWETRSGERRCALVSSFGFSGTNAHLAIEEAPDIPKIKAGKPGYIIALSAYSQEQLKEQARRLAEHYTSEDEIDYACVSYTLLTGRKHLDHRMACIVSDTDDLAVLLNQWLVTGKAPQVYACLSGDSANREQSALKRYGNACIQEITGFQSSFRYMENLATIAELFVKGYDLDYNELFTDGAYTRVPLPTYPFAREKYWLPDSRAAAGKATVETTEQSSDPEAESASRIGVLLSKRWKSSPASSARKRMEGVLILSTEATGGIVRELSRLLPGSDVVLLQGTNVTEQKVNSWDKYSVLIDVAGCEEEGSRPAEHIDWLWLLQQLIEKGRRNELLLLGVTKGLESFENERIRMSGAERAGLYRMLQNEYSHVISRHMDADPSASDTTLAQQIIQEIQHKGKENEVSYRCGQRYSAYLTKIEDIAMHRQELPELQFPAEHVLLITGGTRGLGLLCARHAVKHYGVKRLALVGRTELPPREKWEAFQEQDKETETECKIQAVLELEAQGVQVQVLAFNLTDESSVMRGLEHIRRTLGPIGGVLHAAGIADRDNPAFVRKPLESIQRILAPKITGSYVLHHCLRKEPLQWFVLFSSVAGAMPGLAAGQSDYAMANAYMDYFAQAEFRESPVLSIQWPNWKETGMGEIKSKAYEQSGLLAMTDEEGLLMLDWVLTMKYGPVVLPAVASTNQWGALPSVGEGGAQENFMTASTEVYPAQGHEIRGELELRLRSIFADELNMNPAKINFELSFEHFGVDSIMIAQLACRIERELALPALDPSIFLEYPTLGRLTGILMEDHSKALAAVLQTSEEPRAVQRIPESDTEASKQQLDRSLVSAVRNSKPKVAIIGIACHFPDAPNTDCFWYNLKAGKDSVREVPYTRWDWQKHYDPLGVAGKSISKWGAFLEKIEDFDPDYFQIDEELAVQLDPLQRQWLEVSAEALADAGYGKEQLENEQVGVFAGARTSHFARKVGQSRKSTIIGTGQNFITAHLAHLYNFKGPNVVVDTACSSSLTAVHLAVRSIQNGESDLALAGGVEILLDETPYLSLSAAKVLSPDGKCKSFDAAADGIGIGEGCGVLVLKSLERAVREKDKIYGVIDGSAINNDGQTMGVTTPNPQAQQALLEQAIADANIDPGTISYIEAHGTGTVIGDPIELKALTQVLGKYTQERGICGIGSVKSNTGHLLSAAGAASMIKVLLCMIHGELIPTINCPHPNPRFRFEESPLFLVQQGRTWTAPAVLRAGISTFGLGGNNAHIIVSNEGVPAFLKATLEPRSSRIQWNRRRYWPDAGTEGLDAAVEIQRREQMMAFFKPLKMQ
ncbi:beta-ketoacyl synthase N-terminal-like domain-containing protein [Paenibacillus durus]|uniref:beta-ketoacyl synthase N-terminal-like domain-containing protein n=1 Tax=Paenibacillus durus TaxID=44251 RepID=UPI0006943F45|nr:beta-ketoacyl synthase N-terminal-like domain-containing protein [Paenibacillus durus]